jgi:hypothetical protein
LPFLKDQKRGFNKARISFRDFQISKVIQTL